MGSATTASATSYCLLFNDTQILLILLIFPLGHCGQTKFESFKVQISSNMNFQIKNATSRIFLMKAIQLLFAFIVLMIFRCGYKGNVLYWGEGPELQKLDMRERAENDLVMGTMTATTYFFIILILMIGLLFDDKAKYQLLLFNIFGFLFYIGIGSSQIDIWRSKYKPIFTTLKHTPLALGAMAILTSFIFLIDAVLSIMDIVSK